MAKETIGEVTGTLEKKLHEIWLEEPKEIKELKKRKGAFGTGGALLLYVESETRELIDYLWAIKLVIHEGKVNTDCAKIVLKRLIEAKMNKWVDWYKMKDLPELMKKVNKGLMASTNSSEVVQILEKFLLCVNKFNFWLDSTVPWEGISLAYEHSLGGSIA